MGGAGGGTSMTTRTFVHGFQKGKKVNFVKQNFYVDSEPNSRVDY